MYMLVKVAHSAMLARRHGCFAHESYTPALHVWLCRYAPTADLQEYVTRMGSQGGFDYHDPKYVKQLDVAVPSSMHSWRSPQPA
jgi:hypothetical protein